MHGMMYVGVLMSLCDSDLATYQRWIANVKGVSGASAGSLVGFLAAAGVDPWAMRVAIAACNLGCVLDGLAETSIDEMRAMGALSSGAAADQATRRLVLHVTGNSEITFAGLHDATRRTFIVCVSNLVTGRTEYWSHWTQPSMPVWFALRCSSSVPVVFNAPVFRGCAILDGGLTCNIPCHVFPDTSTLTLFTYTTYERSGGGGGNDCTGEAPCSTNTMGNATVIPDKAVCSTNLNTRTTLGNLAKVAMMGTTNPHISTMRTAPMYIVRSVPCVAQSECVSKYAYNAPVCDTDALISSGFWCLHGVLVRNVLIAILYVMTVAFLQSGTLPPIQQHGPTPRAKLFHQGSSGSVVHGRSLWSTNTPVPNPNDVEGN